MGFRGEWIGEPSANFFFFSLVLWNFCVCAKSRLLISAARIGGNIAAACCKSFAPPAPSLPSTLSWRALCLLLFPARRVCAHARARPLSGNKRGKTARNNLKWPRHVCLNNRFNSLSRELKLIVYIVDLLWCWQHYKKERFNFFPFRLTIRKRGSY